MINSERERPRRQTIKMTIQKNLREASNNGGQKQSNIKTEVTVVMNFIQQTIETLQNYDEQ